MNAIEQIYNQLMNVFGGTNPNQMFTMLMPGTNLNPQTYAFDTTSAKPALVSQAEAKLVDQMFDLTQVTGSSNGQKVSSQYMQALSVLTPNFNPLMPEIKSALRDFLTSSVPENTYLDGQIFTGSLQEYYFRLYDKWVKVKELWEKDCADKRELFSKNPKTEDEKYLEWYEQVAEGRIAEVNEAYGKILVMFAPSDMDAIMGVLASGPGGEVFEATEVVMNTRFSSPNGGFFYPVDMVPNNWFLDLASDINPVDLLKDPQFIASSLTAKRQALQSGVSQAQALLSRMPKDDSAVKAAAAAFAIAQDAFVKAQNDLMNTYTTNTVTAVQMYLSKMSAATVALDAATEVAKNIKDISKAKGDDDNTPSKKGGGSPLTNADIDELAKGQKALIQAQSDLITSSQKLSDAGMSLMSAEAASFGDLPMILSRLQAQLAEVSDLEKQLVQSIVTAPTKTPTSVSTIYEAKYQDAAKVVIQKMNSSKATTSATLITDLDAAITAITDADVKGEFASIKTAATAAHPTPQDVYDAVNTAAQKPSIATKANKADIQKVLDAAKTALNDLEATADKVATAVTTAVNAVTDTDIKKALKPLSDAADKAKAVTASLGETLAAIVTAAKAYTNEHTSKAADSGSRFMDLQFSFSSSEMATSSSTSSSFSQSSWGVDLFFGSVSHSSSSGSSYNSQSMFSSDTEIKIGMKAAKVDIQRGWLDPGVFKITEGMSRLSENKVSFGAISADMKNLNDLNKGILPAFPVSFIVVKDVTMSFKVAESQLSAMHSVVDSKSATGGGFLCFSASSSSSSHSESQSMSSKTEGTVMTIVMPNPQILGWYLAVTPEDKSTKMSTKEAGAADTTINVINFIRKLKEFSQKKA